MKPVLVHNPACSKSREALAFLDQRGVDVELRLYREDPLDEAFLRTLVAKLGVAPAALLRSKEPEYVACGLSSESSVDEVVRAIEAHPVLLERPILIVGDRAAIGRPLANFEALIAVPPRGDDIGRK